MRPVPTEAILKPLPDDTQPKQQKQPSGHGAFSALRHPAYRYFFGGQIVSLIGTWMQTVAQQIVVYQLAEAQLKAGVPEALGSELALGLVACAQGFPAFILAPFSGVIAERFPRRRVLILMQTLMMLTALTLAGLSFAGTLQIWHVIALSFTLGIGTAIEAPTRLSFFTEMVGREDLPSGIVLNSMMFNVARILGPAFGGLALRYIGVSWCFLLNGLSFLAVITGLSLMKLRPITRVTEAIHFFASFKEGLRFSRSHPVIRPLLLLSAISSMFGLTFSVLISPFSDKILGNLKDGTSALLTAQGLGALGGTVLITMITGRGVRGRVMMIGALVGPASVIALALTRTMTLALPLIAVSGFAFVCQFVLTNTLIQNTVPDEFRGRVLSLYTITFFGLSPFGSLLIGVSGQALGVVPTMILFSGGTFIGAAFILWNARHLEKLP
ncbi:MAG TPA: MFS transporter [Aggregatilineales bacterium]|nr:MFS transporter [Anaerolineales bacterium]HRE47612.1 MFS transporter [Aggregatilineales bacterium]